MGGRGGGENQPLGRYLPCCGAPLTPNTGGINSDTYNMYT